MATKTVGLGKTFKEVLANQCDHGMYSQGSSSKVWEAVGEPLFKPNPGCFGAKTYWFVRCCSEPMARCARVQTYKCTRCGHSEDTRESGALALCLVCGKVRDMSGHDSGGPL